MSKNKTSTNAFSNMFGQQKGKCCYCGIKMTQRFNIERKLELTDATVEHFQPRSRGGLDVHWNKKIACHRCNNCKSDMTHEEFWFLAGQCGSVEAMLCAIEWSRSLFKIYNKEKFGMAEMFLHPDGIFKRKGDV